MISVKEDIASILRCLHGFRHFCGYPLYPGVPLMVE